MRRHQFITLLGSAAVASLARPPPADAQQIKLPVIGFLNGFSLAEWAQPVAGFRKGLTETGFVDGRNVAIEYRWAEGRLDRLPDLAAELVRQKVTVLVATGGSSGVLAAAKAATATIPIVFATGSDPVALGLVASFNRPGGIATGVYFLTNELEGKRLGLLRELVPTGSLIAVLLNPKGATPAAQLKDVQAAARTVGQPIHILHASSERELDTAFANFAQLHAAALLVGADPFFRARRDHIVVLAKRLAIPAIYEAREFAEAGGLMSYGTSLTEATRQVGVYAGRILKGERPADLPVVQSDKFEFVINFKTAKALGLTIPQSLSLRADDVIR